jgi:hypothetical protein
LQPVCLLLALHKLGMFGSIRQLLRHPHVVKVGISIAHDMMDLLRSHEQEGKVQVRVQPTASLMGAHVLCWMDVYVQLSMGLVGT